MTPISMATPFSTTGRVRGRRQRSTLSAAAIGTQAFTRSTGSWAADIKGAHIVSAGGAGKAYVRSRDSATQVTCEVFEAFGAASYASGGWTIEGVGQPYGTRWFEDVHIGAKPGNVAVPADVNNAVTPTDNALRDRLRATKMIHNYQSAVGSITHSMANLNASRANARLRPFTINGPEGALWATPIPIRANRAGATTSLSCRNGTLPA